MPNGCQKWWPEMVGTLFYSMECSSVRNLGGVAVPRLTDEETETQRR